MNSKRFELILDILYPTSIVVACVFFPAYLVVSVLQVLGIA